MQACSKPVSKKVNTARVICKAGLLRIVLIGGEVKPGDAVQVKLPPAPWRALEVV